MAPEVAGSIPVSHPGTPDWEGPVGELTGDVRSPRAGQVPGGIGAEVRSSSGRAPVSKTGGCRFESCRACAVLIGSALALSSRGLGRGPLKAQTRVRIPLALWTSEVRPEAVGPIVYRLGRDPFKVERGVRLPLGLWMVGAASSIGRASDS